MGWYIRIEFADPPPREPLAAWPLVLAACIVGSPFIVALGLAIALVWKL